MIIIINGMYGTHITKVAQEISLSLNKPTESELYVKNDGIDISYTTSNQIDGTINTQDDSVVELSPYVDYISEIEKSFKIEDLGDYFIKSYKYDIELPDETEPDFFHSDGSDAYIMDGNDYRPVSIVSRAKTVEKKQKHYVISGHIGKYMIDEIIKLVGVDKVLVYNIIRHPSASHAVYCNIEEDVDEEKLYYDLYNSVLLSKLDYVTTVRYEDVVETKIEIAGKDINILGDAQFRDSHFLEVEPEDLETSDFFTTFTTQYQEIDLVKYMIETTLKDLKSQWKSNYDETLPDLKLRVFDELEY